MVSGRPSRPHPVARVGGWPRVASDDPDVEHIRQIVVRLTGVIEERNFRSTRAAAAEIGMTHQALADLLAGRSWPEVATIARIERALGVRLWPR